MLGAVEAWLLTPLALLYTTVFDTTSWSYFGTDWYTALLLMGCGLTTAVPFILFSYGAQLLPLNLLSIFYFEESFDIPNIIAFSCIWIALAIYTMSNQPKQTK